MSEWKALYEALRLEVIRSEGLQAEIDRLVAQLDSERFKRGVSDRIAEQRTQEMAARAKKLAIREGLMLRVVEAAREVRAGSPALDAALLDLDKLEEQEGS